MVFDQAYFNVNSSQMKFIFRIIIFASVVFIQCNKEKAQSKPNVLFIFADDMTYEAIGGLGHPIVKTPHIDDLIENGTTYSHAYNMGGWHGAICVASRTMLMSGRSIWRAKAIEERWGIKDSLSLIQTWPHLMASAGYDTYMTGKWHVRANAKEVFDVAQNIRGGMPGHQYDFKKANDYLKNNEFDPKGWAEVMNPGYNRPLGEDDVSWSPTDSSFGGFWEGGIHWSEVIANDAYDFLNSSKQSENPFFMYLAFNAPHDHRQAPQEYIDMYPLEEIEVPNNYLDLYPYKDSIGCRPSLRDEALAPFPRTPYAIKTHLQEYYAIISHMDAQIGKICQALKESGQAENTYIIFTADHGLSVGHHGLLGKQNMYDHSMRVPFVITGPDIPKGKVGESEIYLQDAMATALDIAGIEKPIYVDFKSLMSDAKGIDNSANRLEIVGYYEHNQRMIRKDGFKLIAYPRVPKLRLFDLANDPLEMNDLSEDDSFAEIKERLFHQLVISQKEAGDFLELNWNDYL